MNSNLITTFYDIIGFQCEMPLEHYMTGVFAPITFNLKIMKDNENPFVSKMRILYKATYIKNNKDIYKDINEFDRCFLGTAHTSVGDMSVFVIFTNITKVALINIATLFESVFQTFATENIESPTENHLFDKKNIVLSTEPDYMQVQGKVCPYSVINIFSKMYTSFAEQKIEAKVYMEVVGGKTRNHNRIPSGLLSQLALSFDLNAIANARLDICKNVLYQSPDLEQYVMYPDLDYKDIGVNKSDVFRFLGCKNAKHFNTHYAVFQRI